MAETPSVGKGDSKPLLYRLLAASAARYALVGVAFYGVARFAFALHYGRFGITPEEAGVDYGRTLVQSVYYVLYLAIGFPLLFGAFFGVVFVAPAWLLSRRVRRWLRLPRPATLGWTFLTTFMLALFVGLPTASWASAGALLSDRDWVATGPLATALGDAFGAHRVTVHTTSQEVLPQVRDGACMLHLGTAGGWVVLYDPRARMVHRVPQGLLILTTRPGVDTACVDR